MINLWTMTQSNKLILDKQTHQVLFTSFIIISQLVITRAVSTVD